MQLQKTDDEESAGCDYGLQRQQPLLPQEQEAFRRRNQEKLYFAWPLDSQACQEPSLLSGAGRLLGLQRRSAAAILTSCWLLVAAAVRMLAAPVFTTHQIPPPPIF